MKVNSFSWMHGTMLLGRDFVYLKILREDNDLTQDEIAKILNITRQQYSLYETRTRTIPIDLLDKLADLYKTSTDYLLNRTNEKRDYNR